MIKVPNNFGNEGISSNNADISNSRDMANVYINHIGKNIETVNSCVMLSEQQLAYIIQRAFIEGWRCKHKLYHSPNKFGSIDDARVSVSWSSLEKALENKKGFFSDIIYETPFLSKEYALKEFGISESDFEDLPEVTKKYFSQTYYKEED